MAMECAAREMKHLVLWNVLDRLESRMRGIETLVTTIEGPRPEKPGTGLVAPPRSVPSLKEFLGGAAEQMLNDLICRLETAEAQLRDQLL